MQNLYFDVFTDEFENRVTKPNQRKALLTNVGLQFLFSDHEFWSKYFLRFFSRSTSCSNMGHQSKKLGNWHESNENLVNMVSTKKFVSLIFRSSLGIKNWVIDFNPTKISGNTFGGYILQFIHHLQSLIVLTIAV